MFFIPWRGVPPIPARRSLTGSGRPMELGRSAGTLRPALRGRGSSAKAPPDSTARRWVSAVLSRRFFRLASWGVLYPLAGGAADFGAAQFDRLGPPDGARAIGGNAAAGAAR